MNTPRIQMVSNHRGFTLIELVITVVIVIILGALAVPAMTNLMVKHRAQDAASELFATLFKARSEALRRVDQVILQPASSTDWTSGWNMNDSAGKLIDTHPPLVKATSGQKGLSIAFTGDIPIVYTSVGRISSAKPTFTISASNGGYSCTYKVAVDASGRPYETTSGALATDKATGGGAPAC